MTGPEHYREAERLLSTQMKDGAIAEYADFAVINIAQVHATLALAAATALQPGRVPNTSQHGEDWMRATGPQP